MADRRNVPETANRSDWPRLVAMRINDLLRRMDTAEGDIAMAGVERDTDGNPVPTWTGHTYTYDGSGNLETDTVTDGTDTWVRTYTWAGSALSSDSGWVKQ